MAKPVKKGDKGAAIPVKRTKKQQAAAEKRKAEKAEADALESAATKRKQEAARLAQMVNLTISGYSLAEIGEQIGASADEVDEMLTRDAARYVRNQPALRVYIRNWISGKYAAMIEADYNEATDRAHPKKLENQDRVDRFLRAMARLHGAEAPTQSEVKVEAAPENVEKMVQLLSAARGVVYDDTVFDAEWVEEVVDEGAKALEVSGNAVGEPQPGDEDMT